MAAVNRHLALEEELVLPLYTAMNDQERWDSITLKDIPILIPITTEEISLYYESIGRWVQMNELAVIDQSQTPPEPINSIAYHAVLSIESFTEYDMANPTANQVLTDLLAELEGINVLSAQDVANILAMGDSFIGRDDEIGVSNCTIGEVEQARTS